MTNATLISRVQSLAGEGFEDWDASTRSAIRESIIVLVKSRNFNISDYPGLVVEKDIVPGVTTTSIAFSTIIPSGYELVEWLSIKKRPTGGTGSTDTNISIITFPQYEAYTMNTNLLRSNQSYAYVTYTTVPTLQFDGAFVATDTLKIKAIMWYDTILTASALELSVYFSDAFLDAVIAMAVQRLQAEINA